MKSSAYPRFFILSCLIAISVCSMFFSGASASDAPDITDICTFEPVSNKSSFKRCLDRNYMTYWKSNGGKYATVTVTVPESSSAGGIYLQWFDHPRNALIEFRDESGNWQPAGETKGVYLAEYVPLPSGTRCFRIKPASGNSTQLVIAELTVFGEGEAPKKVQKWESPLEKSDLLLVVAHPDDEVLWFGGLLPTYAGDLQKAVQVCVMVPTSPFRRLELLDCLWTCGVRNYPVWGGFRDSFSSSLKGQYQKWNKDHVYTTIAEWIRRFKPDVLITHDIDGEYGHGAHRACADAVIHLLDICGDPDKYPESAKKYGAWNVPKCYIHLYKENPIQMDWHKPLASFGGKSSFDIAEKAFSCHVSQKDTQYRVEDFGPYDNSKFGLVRSLVGPDLKKDDLFENLDGFAVAEPESQSTAKSDSRP